MDGAVIGGPAHGERRDPDRHGPVLVVPIPITMPERFSAHWDPSPMGLIAEPRAEYKLHNFHSTDGKERFRWRVWLPIEVEPHRAFEFIIANAMRAPKPDDK